MKERGILMSAPMVLATLRELNPKTQTRRVCKLDVRAGMPEPERQSLPKCCPYGLPGDRLWVRETFFAYGRWETRYSTRKGRDEWFFIDMTLERGHEYGHAADGHSFAPHRRTAGVTPCWWKRPAIFMPRAASRITLEVLNVGVERLGDISEADALAEGLSSWSKDGRLVKYGIPDRDGLPGADDLGWPWHEWCRWPQDAFFNLIDRIHGDDGPSRASWVWVVQFKRVTP